MKKCCLTLQLKISYKKEILSLLLQVSQESDLICEIFLLVMIKGCYNVKVCN